MENHRLITTNPETIRLTLTTQDENLQRLRNIVTHLEDKSLRELQLELSEQLNLLEQTEHEMWATLFPAYTADEPTHHRMTMTYVSYHEQYY